MIKNRDTVQDEALAAIKRNRRCTVGVSMGVGKTLIGLLDMSNKIGRFLVVAPKKSIFATWKQEAEKHNLEYLLANITFSTYVGLHKHNLNDYDKLYLDECHSLTEANAIVLRNFNGDVLGLTGTPPKAGDKKMYVDMFCPVVYEYIVDNAVGDKILNDYKIYVHYVHLDKRNNVRVELKGRKPFYTSEVNNYDYISSKIITSDSPQQQQFLRIMRMKQMQAYASKEEKAKELLKNIKEKCLVFANTKEQADRLCSYSYHSGNTESETNLELFKKGVITKMSCVLQLNEGVNIPGLRTSIILHAYGNERKFTQRLGRCLRLPVNETAIVHLLCHKETIDEQWIHKALQDLDDSKIIYVE
jgi:superfamily II DNA or RNA helicase